MEKLVTPRAASAWASSVSTSGWRNATSAWPVAEPLDLGSGSASATFATRSASAYSSSAETSRAPASS